jgi:hypothetical protein
MIGSASGFINLRSICKEIRVANGDCILSTHVGDLEGFCSNTGIAVTMKNVLVVLELK